VPAAPRDAVSVLEVGAHSRGSSPRVRPTPGSCATGSAAGALPGIDRMSLPDEGIPD